MKNNRSVANGDEASPFIPDSSTDPALRPAGYGILKGQFSICKDIDLTKPIWEQVFARDRVITKPAKEE